MFGEWTGQKEGQLFLPLKKRLMETRETFFPACLEEAFVCGQVKGEGGTLIAASYGGWRWGVGVPHDLWVLGWFKWHLLRDFQSYE